MDFSCHHKGKKKKSMPTGKGGKKHGSYKKFLYKKYNTASWKERVTGEKENEGVESDISDPELIAEREYEAEHGKLVTVDNRGTEPLQKSKDDESATVKVKLSKADRKARCRGVSGCMTKKDRAISWGSYNAAMLLDEYDGVGFDDDYYDDECFSSDMEEYFGCQEDKDEKKQLTDAEKLAIMGGDHVENDPPGPSGLHHETVGVKNMKYFPS